MNLIKERARISIILILVLGITVFFLGGCGTNTKKSAGDPDKYVKLHEQLLQINKQVAEALTCEDFKNFDIENALTVITKAKGDISKLTADFDKTPPQEGFAQRNKFIVGLLREEGIIFSQAQAILEDPDLSRVHQINNSIKNVNQELSHIKFEKVDFTDIGQIAEIQKKLELLVNFYNEPKAPLVKEDCILAGLNLNMASDEIEGKIGKLKAIEEIPVNYYLMGGKFTKNFYHYYDSVELLYTEHHGATDKAKVTSIDKTPFVITLTGAKFATSRDIRVGDLKTKIFFKYPKASGHEYIRFSDKKKLISYNWNIPKSASHLTIIVDPETNRIIEILTSSTT